jgi:hypothetical protein
MQARRSSLYVKKPPEEFFSDTVDGLVDGTPLTSRTPSIAGEQYRIGDESAVVGSCLQYGSVGIKPASTADEYHGNILVPDSTNPLPVQGHFGITIEDCYINGTDNLFYRNQCWVYPRIAQTHLDSMLPPNIRWYMTAATYSDNRSKLVLQYNLGAGYITLDTSIYSTSKTGRIRFETELTVNTLRVHVAAPDIGYNKGPYSFDVSGTDFTIRSGAGIKLRARTNIGNTAIHFPIIMDGKRELLV